MFEDLFLSDRQTDRQTDRQSEIENKKERERKRARENEGNLKSFSYCVFFFHKIPFKNDERDYVTYLKVSFLNPIIPGGNKKVIFQYILK